MQVATLETMISFVKGYGGDHKRSNAVIELAQLNATLASAQTMLDSVAFDRNAISLPTPSPSSASSINWSSFTVIA